MKPVDEHRNFASDNVEGASAEVIAAIARANPGQARPYGADEVSDRLQARFRELFEHQHLTVLLVPSGTAANALCLSVLCPPWGSVLCHRDAHVLNDECGAPEFFGDGLRLFPLEGASSRLEVPDIVRVAARDRGDVHSHQASCVTVTQATEGGTVYDVERLARIGAACRGQGLRMHMDGARFANALVQQGCSPADMTWRCGVDLLSFGATKNGTLGAEAIVCFDPQLTEPLAFRRKRGGHLSSKMRFLAAQLEAYLEDDLWLRNARHANSMAQRLAAGLRDLPGISLVDPVEANLLFARLPESVDRGLREHGFWYYPDRRDPAAVRLATSFSTSPEAVDALIATARDLLA